MRKNKQKKDGPTKGTELTREEYFKLLHKATAPLAETKDKDEQKKDNG